MISMINFNLKKKLKKKSKKKQKHKEYKDKQNKESKKKVKKKRKDKKKRKLDVVFVNENIFECSNNKRVSKSVPPSFGSKLLKLNINCNENIINSNTSKIGNENKEMEEMIFKNKLNVKDERIKLLELEFDKMKMERNHFEHRSIQQQNEISNLREMVIILKDKLKKTKEIYEKSVHVIKTQKNVKKK
eukprot:12652_1